MVTGGHNYDFSLDSTELYDPSIGHWRMSGALPHASALRAATVDNRVLVFGETINNKNLLSLSYHNHGLYIGDLENTVLEFDPHDETFTEVGHTSQYHGSQFAVSVIKFSDYLDWCMP